MISILERGFWVSYSPEGEGNCPSFFPAYQLLGVCINVAVVNTALFASKKISAAKAVATFCEATHQSMYRACLS